MILVSACLLGLNTRYDGGNNKNELLLKYSRFGRYIPVCPEQLGGLTTPRKPVEIRKIGDNLQCFNVEGEDLTKEFIKGAHEVEKLVQLFPVKGAIFKEKSPSCGVHLIYDGSFQHRLISGQGVATMMLMIHNIPVYSDAEVTEEKLKELLGVRD